MREQRIMKRGKGYEIEERTGKGSWSSICECKSLEDAKELLETLGTLEGEE